MSLPRITLPGHRPLTSAHRAGNDIAFARKVIARGVDLLETDIWLHNGQLELRHRNTMGPIPLLWDRWSLRPGWGPRLLLRDLLEATSRDAMPFLDLKGEELDLAPEIVREVRRVQPGRHVVMCGRNWPQLDPVVAEPDVTIFYSVGDEEERSAVVPRLTRMEAPALSIRRELITPDFMARITYLGTTVIGWAVNTTGQARQLYDLGVDGFTSDNLDLLYRIAEQGPAALCPPDGA